MTIKTLPIVGARFRPPAQEVLDNLPANAKLILRRQPDNPYDSNAVQVCLFNPIEESDTVHILLVGAEHSLADPFHLGFIPREAAKEIAPLMDTPALYGDEPTAWPGLLTFLMHGGPGVRFEVPSDEN